MTYYNFTHNNEWLYEDEDGTGYIISVYQEEYPDGSSTPVTGTADELSTAEKRHYLRKDTVEKAKLSNVPNVVIDKSERIQ